MIKNDFLYSGWVATLSNYVAILSATLISMEIVAAGVILFKLISRSRLVAKAGSQSHDVREKTSHLRDE
jgi:hypothetical protein